MKNTDFVKEGDWIVSNDIETPNEPETGSMLHRILKELESTVGRVTVEVFTTELAKAMKELETHMRILTSKLLGELTEAKNIVEENYIHLKDKVEKVRI